MNLGTFSISLAVSDIAASRAFYEKLGFEMIDGKVEVDGTTGQAWAMMKNGDAYIGLFQGMFDHNIITFNPLDIRAVQSELRERGIELSLHVENQEDGSGPAYGMLTDPDGNTILIDTK